MLICDFCAAADPEWEYMARDAQLPNGKDSIGSWCACETCRDLIDEGEREALAERSYHRAAGLMPLEEIRATHAVFFQVRTSDARLIEMTPIHGRIFER